MSRRSEREVIADIVKTATPESVATTDANDKTIHSTTTNKKYRVKLIYVWNSSAAEISVTGFRFGTGDYHFASVLMSKTGFIINVIGVNWQGAEDEDFIVKASGAGLNVTVFGEEL